MTALQRFADLIDRADEALGSAVSWLVLPLVLLQFVVVLLRYVFGYGLIAMQELIVYFHAFSFMLGAAAVLLRGKHVRVDIFYSARDARGKAKVDLFGSLFFLLPFTILILVVATPVAISSWVRLEGSFETTGIQAVFLLKSLPVAFAALVLVQGLSMAARSILVLTGHIGPQTRATGSGDGDVV